MLTNGLSPIPLCALGIGSIAAYIKFSMRRCAVYSGHSTQNFEINYCELCKRKDTKSPYFANNSFVFLRRNNSSIIFAAIISLVLILIYNVKSKV